MFVEKCWISACHFTQVAHFPLPSAEVEARYTVEEAYEERDAAI